MFGQFTRLLSSPIRVRLFASRVLCDEAKGTSSSAPKGQALEPLLDKVNKLNVLSPYSSRGGEVTRFVRALHGAIGKPDAHRSRGGEQLCTARKCRSGEQQFANGMCRVIVSWLHQRLAPRLPGW